MPRAASGRTHEAEQGVEELVSLGHSFGELGLALQAAAGVVGAALATKYGWKIGDRIPLHSTIWTRKDNGSSDWNFEIVGIYTVPTDVGQENQFFFQHENFDEARAFRLVLRQPAAIQHEEAWRMPGLERNDPHDP